MMAASGNRPVTVSIGWSFGAATVTATLGILTRHRVSDAFPKPFQTRQPPRPPAACGASAALLGAVVRSWAYRNVEDIAQARSDYDAAEPVAATEVRPSTTGAAR